MTRPRSPAATTRVAGDPLPRAGEVGGEVAGAVVMMLKGENSSDVIKNVKERIAQIQKTLPEGVVIDPFLDRTKMVNNAISTVETNYKIFHRS